MKTLKFPLIEKIDEKQAIEMENAGAGILGYSTIIDTHFIIDEDNLSLLMEFDNEAEINIFKALGLESLRLGVN